MKIPISRRTGLLVLTFALASALGGCAVYEPAPAYYDSGTVIYTSPRVYRPAPVYVAPPSLYFGFRSGGWGHRGHYGHGWRGRGWHGRH
jgi:hypothetical protein